MPTAGRMAETLDEEVEKRAYPRHAMATLRIDRGKWHGLSRMMRGQYGFETTVVDGLGNN